MNDINGFGEYKRMLLDDRELNRKAHEAICTEMRDMHDDILAMKLKLNFGGKAFTMAWGAAGWAAVQIIYLVVALGNGGCNAG